MANSQNHLIAWQKWSDPFGTEEDDKLYDPYLAEFYDESSDDDEEDNHQDPDEHDDLEKNLPKSPKRVRVIATPMGIIPMNDNTVSGKIFNFWTGHTNFDITKNVAETIELTDGVETLDIFTRYRFRIAVGKAFDDSSVMRDINRRVYAELSHVE